MNEAMERRAFLKGAVGAASLAAQTRVTSGMQVFDAIAIHSHNDSILKRGGDRVVRLSLADRHALGGDRV